MSHQMNRVAAQLTEVERMLAGQAGVPVRQPATPPAPVPVAPSPVPAWAPVAMHPMMPPPVPLPPRAPLTERRGTDKGQGWIGKLLAVVVAKRANTSQHRLHRDDIELSFIAQRSHV